MTRLLLASLALRGLASAAAYGEGMVCVSLDRPAARALGVRWAIVMCRDAAGEVLGLVTDRRGRERCAVRGVVEGHCITLTVCDRGYTTCGE